MKTIFTFLFFFSLLQYNIAQTIPANRTVDWTLAGMRDTFSYASATTIDMQTMGVLGDSVTNNDAALSAVLSCLSGSNVLLFPAGNFVFNSPIELPSNTIIKGAGADSTLFLMDLGGNGNAIEAKGNITTDTTNILTTTAKDSNTLVVFDATKFVVGDWVQLKQVDTALVTSSWSNYQTGQISQIKAIDLINNEIILQSPLRMDYDTAQQPYLVKINPAEKVGVECLSIERIDDTAPQQSANVYFKYAVNCWIKGIASNFCTFSHVKVEQSANIKVAQSYFHHAFDYGDGGRAYGVVLQFATSECLIEDNVFEHLRHSVLLQAGANGNVTAYNYSFDPFWVQSGLPADAAGDLVLHGNYVYANLFEQNICRNIVIDNSHGPNGPNNTFFRNRAEGFGIFFSAANSPNQVIVGNAVTNTGFPYSFANYSIQGTGHFLHGNNDKGTIKPTGTSNLPDLTYAYTSRPNFIPANQWGGIGTPNTVGVNSIPAKDRFINNQFFATSCTTIITSTPTLAKANNVTIYPNPSQKWLNIASENTVERLIVRNELGQVVLQLHHLPSLHTLDIEKWSTGLYFLTFELDNQQVITKKLFR